MRALLFVLLMLAACSAPSPRSPSFVEGPRVVNVSSEPPEASPGEPVTFRARVAGANASSLSWSWCRTGTAPTDPDSVSGACIARAGSPLVTQNGQLTAPIPSDACTVFGPLPPPGGARPHDPDSTGGYYQPIRVSLGDQLSFAFQRVRCELASAPLSLATEFRTRYVANRNPKLLSVNASIDGNPVALDALPANHTVQLSAQWDPDSAETFIRFDPVSQSLQDAVESLDLSWFSSAGALERAKTTSGENVWRTEGPGAFSLWVVLRDSRGGSSDLEVPVVVRTE